jgi:hypothetical protein
MSRLIRTKPKVGPLDPQTEIKKRLPMSIINSNELLHRLERIEALLQRGATKAYYTVDEFADLVGRRPFTVRQWANMGRIHASHSMTQTGSSHRWAISHEEYLRFQREGLLPAHRSCETK